jgi:hypothetical protein
MKRTSDPGIIEQRLLDLAYTTDAPITVATLAYYAPCSIDDAERVLDNLVTRDRIQMEVDDNGHVHYIIPNRHKLEPHPEPPRALVPRPHNAIPLALRGGRDASPPLAAVLSLVIPGAGQLYTGNLASAILWFILVTAGYTLFLPGLFLHLFCIASAASSAYRLNSNLARLRLAEGHT